MMENNLVLILIVLVLVLMIAMGIMMLLIFKLFLLKPIIEKTTPCESPIDSHPVNMGGSIKKLSEEKVKESYFCPNHIEAETTGACLICEEAFCPKCLIEHESLNFCKDHFRIFAQNKWTQISDVKTTPDTPDDALYVYHFKRHLWREYKKPSYVITHYKINIEEDFIESFVQLFVLEKEADDLKNQLDKKKGQD